MFLLSLYSFHFLITSNPLISFESIPTTLTPRSPHLTAERRLDSLPIKRALGSTAPPDRTVAKEKSWAQGYGAMVGPCEQRSGDPMVAERHGFRARPLVPCRWAQGGATILQARLVSVVDQRAMMCLLELFLSLQ